MSSVDLQDMKAKSPGDLLAYAEELEIEAASTLRKQELMFAILKELSVQETSIIGQGTLEVLPDGFGFLRSVEANYLSGPDDIYVSPGQVRKFSLRSGDTVQARSAARRTASATSPCSRSTRSISKPRRRSATASISTI